MSSRVAHYWLPVSSTQSAGASPTVAGAPPPMGADATGYDIASGGWMIVIDALRFTEAGLAKVTQSGLDTVHQLDRRTASLRWRIAGRPCPFFTLVWHKPS
ncbi:MAG: hypothetical protein ACRDTC_27795 [Pseudonocardiaceae bacterium]